MTTALYFVYRNRLQRFFSLAELKNHSVYHLAQRSHVCPVCGDGFFEKRHLERHVRRKHHGGGGRNFFCSDCGRAFCERYELNYHRKHSKKCNAAATASAVTVAVGEEKEERQERVL